MSHAEAFCKAAATRVVGPVNSSGSTDEIGAPDLAALFELIMQIVTTIIDKCPSNTDAKIVQTIRKPNLIARARFRREAAKACDECWTYRWQSQAGPISQAIWDEAAAASDADLLAALFTLKNDDWVLA